MHALVFDLDGTLVDTAQDLAAAVNRCRTRRGLAPTPLHELRPWTSHGARGMIRCSFGIGPEDPGYDELRSELRAQGRASSARERANAATTPRPKLGSAAPQAGAPMLTSASTHSQAHSPGR